MDKLLKVTLEFEDKIQILEGEQATKWLKAINDDCIMEAIHGRHFPEFSWKVFERKEK